MEPNPSLEVTELPTSGSIPKLAQSVPIKDPVKVQKKVDRLAKNAEAKVQPPVKTVESVKIKPSMGTRIELQSVPDLKREENQPRVRYVFPKRTKKQQKIFEKNRANTALKYFCKHDDMGMPSPIPSKKINIKLNVPSAEIAEAKVKTKDASPDPSWIYPYPPTEEELTLKKPKSGIFINETGEEQDDNDYDSFDLVYRRQPRPREKDAKKKYRSSPQPRKSKKKKSKGKRKRAGEAKFSKALLDAIQEEMPEDFGEGAMDNYLTKQFRRKVSLISKTTSYQSGDLKSITSLEEEKELEMQNLAKYLQKFRRESEMKRYEPPKRKIKRGTLESHSFTDVKCQPTLKEFYFGSKEGSMHQGDDHFNDSCRDRQGICMSVAAFCYAILKHPNKWISENIDEILEIGNDLYNQSVAVLHKHNPGCELSISELPKFCYIGEKKIQFLVDEAEVAGFIRSEDKRIYNLTKGLRIFFSRQSSGIFQSHNVNIAIWKDKHYYFFDAKPRTKDLYTSPNGTAIMGHFYDIASIVSVLLDRSNYGNWPFVIYAIKAFKILDKNEEICNVMETRSNYIIINENKAVVQASFELTDKCFDFTRNKQALAMATVSLVYSRITPPSAWHRTTIDKIMIIGNQLYLECMQCKSICDLSLENLPALFTVGPYIVEIYIYANRFGDVMYKKCCCQLQSCLEEFFEKNTNALLQIEKFTLAVWKQRNMFFCFDPYSRNGEGLQCRDGVACVSMHSNIESLVSIIITNFDTKDYIFYIHALKVCKIHRDPVQSELFPKHLTMNEYPMDYLKKYKMRKSKKLAISKPITVDYSALAMRKLLAGEEPDKSICEVGSTVESLAIEQLPPMVQKHPSRLMLKLKLPKPVLSEHFVADLDSPSLSDTQIEPKLPLQPKEPEEITFMDLDSFELTQEEIELQSMGEGEHEPLREIEGGAGDYGEEEDGEEDFEGMGEDDFDDWYLAQSQFAQVGSHSLESPSISRTSEEMNTEITYLPIVKEILYPTYIRGRQEMKKRLKPMELKDDEWNFYLSEEPLVTKSQELLKETNFVDLPDDSQIIRGSKNLVQFGDEIEFMAPFICVMAGVVARKYSIYTWTSDIVDYILKCGVELYKSSKLRYDQMARLEIPKVTLGKTDFKVLVEYIFDAYTRQNILEMAIEKVLLIRSDVGVLVTPTYACAIIRKNHLYYLFDGFGNNEVGLSEGVSNEGCAFIGRFKDAHSLTIRILYNKKKRDEGLVYSRFVLSAVRVKLIHKPPGKEDEVKDAAEEEMEQQAEEGEEESAAKKAKAEEKFSKKSAIGYQYKNGLFLLEGTMKLKGRKTTTSELKEDHFVGLCACLLLLSCPIDKWTEKKVDQVIDLGKHIHAHAEDLEMSDKRKIKNVLMEKNYIDITVKKIKIENWKNNQNLFIGLDTMLFTKRLSYFLVQFPNACYAIHKTEDGLFHLFDPYGSKKRKNDEESSNGGWVRCRDVQVLKHRLKRLIVPGAESYCFYNFEVTSIQRAPKDVLLSYRLHQQEMEKKKKEEIIGKPFHEDVHWLDMLPIPWTRTGNKAAAGHDRGENMWNNWETEYEKDLYSMMGNINQKCEKFAVKSRGKQTLCNLIVSIGMMEIYDLTEWNSAVIDSILVNGDFYFMDCIKEIEEENYELTFDDLKEDCGIFPYTFKVAFQPIVDGTMFLVRSNQYNLYKALRYFFDEQSRRCGVICVTKTNTKKLVSFGKLSNREYFMFDCDSFGAFMFPDKVGFPYLLRMTAFNRLVHALTLTLRGGDFYIFEVKVNELQPVT